MTPNKLITIVGPVYNEESCIRDFYESISKVFVDLPCDAEFLFVDDGSQDGTCEILSRLQADDPRVRVLRFSRNFGHQIAIKAGIDHAEGDAVIIMDTDLQDPPSAIPDMINKWNEGFDVVYAVRSSRAGESFLKRWTAKVYYRLMKRLSNMDIPLDVGDFRLLSRPVANVLKGINERAPYVRGLVSWVGFKQTGVMINREARRAGKTKYSWPKMIRFAWSGITHFSFLPLQIATIVGLITALASLVSFFFICYVTLVLKIAVSGWASLMVAILFLGSVQLITLGIIGSYLAKNYDETRQRPLYIIQEEKGNRVP